jgi:D-aminopeptidase
MTAPDPHLTTPGGKPRARALGIPFGGRPGRWNAITDVPGVEVGYVTLIDGSAVRTGVTAWERLDPYHEAVVQACEEAVVNALVANEDMTGRDGHRTRALPRDRVSGLLAAAGRLR